MRLFWKGKRNREYSLLITATCLLSGSPEVESLCIDHSAGSPGEVFAPCRGIMIPDSGKFSLVDWFQNPGNFAIESRIPGLWIRECSSGNPEYRFGLKSGLQYLESGMHGIWNPKYKTVLDSIGRKCQGCPASREWIHQTGTFWNWNWSSETFGRRWCEMTRNVEMISSV